MSRHVLIAGCGAVGSSLGRRLVGHGHRVWGIRRNVDALPKGIEPWAADLTDASSLGAPPAPFDTVFYTAAAGERSEERYKSVYVLGLRAILNLLADNDAPVRRAFFTSSTAVYGQTDGSWVDEESVTEPAHFTGKILLEAEQTLAESPWESASIRLGGIYGPGRTRLLRQVWTGQAIASSAFSNRIHVDDCAGALAHLMEVDSLESCYVGVDHEPAPLIEVVRWMAEQLGVTPPDHSDEKTTGRGTNKRCNGQHLVDSGYAFEYPSYREGYLPIIRDFLANQAPTG